jgi:PKD repeat protein
MGGLLNNHRHPGLRSRNGIAVVDMNRIRVTRRLMIFLPFILLWLCILPVSAANCDGPPKSQIFVLQTGGCDLSPAAVPCTQNFNFPAQASLSGDPATQYYLDFGDGTIPYYGFNDMVTHTYTYPGTYLLKYRAGTECDRWIEGNTTLTVETPPNYTPVLHGCAVVQPQSGFSGAPLTGIAPLTVQFTSSSTGANVYLWDFGDGATSPAQNPRHTYMTGGLYSVTLEARDICSNTASRATMSHFVTVTVQSGTLAITTTPQSANVFLDNVFKGVTPLTLSDTPSGYHILRITLPGYEDYTTSATVEPGNTALVQAVLLKSGAETAVTTVPPTTVATAAPQQNGSVAITSVPSGASVTLDGLKKGITPLILSEVLPGNHELTLEYSGYTTLEQTVSVGSAQTAAINANLVVASGPAISTGSLRVITDPPGAQVSVDGNVKGVSPATIPGLSAGAHTLLLNLQDYQDLSTTVNITAGETQDYTTGLRKVYRPSLVDIGLASVVVLIVIGAGLYRLFRKDEI